MNYKEKLNSLIPGGAHTYSRGHDQYPCNAPEILVRGEGSYVWDTDGRKFLDYGMGLRAVGLGYAYKPVADAAIREIWNGNNLTRASTIELKAAETITELIDGAEMVKFAKNGSTVTTAALKLARAYTGRKLVAVCADHPFFSYDDWFIGATAVPRGVPEEIQSLSLKFKYNDVQSLQALFDRYPGQIAAVMLEPVTVPPPHDDFLLKVQNLCRKNGTVFILDEMITGFRFHLKGAQHIFKLKPDLSTFGKAMANGFSVAALVGRRDIMELGGITKEGAERVFLVSTTHGAEMCGMGAFVKTVEIYASEPVIGHVWDYGQKLINGMNTLAKEAGVESYFKAEGYPCSPAYITKDSSGKASLEMRTLFSQELIKHGVLMPWIALSYSHGEQELEKTLDAVRKALGIYAKAITEGVGKYLVGPAIKPVFRKHN